MLTISPSIRISLCTMLIDMRKSFDGLLAIVRNLLEADPLTDQLFVFLNRQHSLMKILYLGRRRLCHLVQTPRMP